MSELQSYTTNVAGAVVESGGTLRLRRRMHCLLDNNRQQRKSVWSRAQSGDTETGSVGAIMMLEAGGEIHLRSRMIPITPPTTRFVRVHSTVHLVSSFWEYGDESRRCPFGVFGPPARTNEPLAIIMRDQIAGLRVRRRPPEWIGKCRHVSDAPGRAVESLGRIQVDDTQISK